MNLAVIILLINIILFGAIAYYSLFLRKQMKDEREEELKERKFDDEQLDKAENQLKDELNEVRRRANKILEESQTIAMELVNELENTLGRDHANVSALSANPNNFEFELGSLSQKIKQHYMVRIQKLLSSLETYKEQQAQKVADFVDTQDKAVEKSLAETRADELRKAQDRIKRYEEEELKLFHSKVKQIIDNAAIEVLGHSLTNYEQEELISKALERAKQENVL